MDPKRVDPAYDRLVQLIYLGATEPQPWQSALPALREIMDAQVASLVLRPPSVNDRGVILNSVRPESSRDEQPPVLADQSDWEVTAYREQFFSLDPFVNLPLDQVTALEDILPDAQLQTSEYYLQYLQPVDLFRILGVDTAEPGGMLARLRFSRRASEPCFSQRDRRLLTLLTPHLRQAIQIYAKLNRMTSERDVYQGAVDQLSVATIILDEHGRLLNTNAVASALLTEANGLCRSGQHLQIEDRSINRKLQEALISIIRAQQSGETSVVRALRIPRTNGKADLGLVIRPAPASEWSEGQSSPCAAVFISDPELREPASRQILAELFDLTPAETNVAILLSRGLSLAEVAQAQNISRHTARAQLKAIFSKTGVSRQAELVRMVVKSVASLG